MGEALVAGDFDLAIELGGEGLAGKAWCGARMILEGAAGSLFDFAQSRWIDKSDASIPGDPLDNDAFAAVVGG